MRKRFAVQMLLATLAFAIIGFIVALSVGAPDCSSQSTHGPSSKPSAAQVNR
jgi:hypothetical protein